jgi:polysaccharide export outer membrane protein
MASKPQMNTERRISSDGRSVLRLPGIDRAVPSTLISAPSAFPASVRVLMASALLLGPIMYGVRAASAAGDEKPAARHSVYRLRPMDLIKVQVFQEPDMDRELRVSRDYGIVMPLLGMVDVKNLSVRDAELLLTELYRKDYLVNPQINITVIEYAPRTVNVLGAVNTPGSVLIPPEKDLTLLDVIAKSGGFSRLANRGKVSLTRNRANGDTENYSINADQLMTGDGATRWLVQDGDIINVPERVL